MKRQNDHPSVAFLNAIYQHCEEGFIELRLIPKDSGHPIIDRFVPLKDIHLIPTILEPHLQKYNCYFTVAPRKDGDGSKDGIIRIPCLWADVDNLDDDFLVRCKSFLLKPTLVVDSGHGRHLYWRLREPLLKSDIMLVENLNKRLASYFRADEGTVDASRVLRIVGTFNLKDEDGKEVRILSLEDNNEYNPSDFDFLAPIPGKERGNTEQVLAPGWEKNLLKGVSEGERNIAITRLAGRYLGKGLARPEVLPILIDANSRFSPPLEMKEVESCLDSVMKTHGRNHPDSSEEQRKSDTHPDGNPPILPTLADIYDMDIQVEWAVDKLVPKQGVTVLPGKGGIGKTWLQLQMGSNVADGVPFVGQLPVLKMPVYYVDFENSLATLHDRAVVLGRSGLQVWHVSNPVPPPRLDSKEWERYKKLPPGLLIFDTLRASQLLDENSSKDMALIMMRLKELRDMGFTIILIHHTPKADERTYKGSTAIQDLCDHVLSLERVRGVGDDQADDEDWKLPLRLGVRGKTRYEPFSIYLVFDPTKGFEVAPDPDDESLRTIHFLIVKFKEENGTAPNQSQIATAVKDHGINPKRLYRLLRKGEGEYWRVVTSPKTRAKLYEPITEVIYPSSPPIYMGENGKMAGIRSPRPSERTLMLPIKNTPFSHSSEGIRNNGKIDDFHFSEDVEENRNEGKNDRDSDSDESTY